MTTTTSPKNLKTETEASASERQPSSVQKTIFEPRYFTKLYSAALKKEKYQGQLAEEILFLAIGRLLYKAAEGTENEMKSAKETLESIEKNIVKFKKD